MRTFIMCAVLFCLPALASAQACAECPPLASGPATVGLSLGLAVAPLLELPQEKAPPDSVPVDVEPVVKKRAMPVYPEVAKKAGIQGKVYVRFCVDTEGKVRDATIAKSENEVLNQAAIDAAKQWEFEPAKAKGKAVSVWLTVPFQFKLAEKSSGVEIPRLKEGSMNEALGCITTLLSGKDIDNCKSSISAESTAIIGGKYMPLLEAIDKWGKPGGLPNERGWQIDYVRTVADDGVQVVTLIVRNVDKKSGASRYHTVVCERAKEGWRIQHWHTM
jgi:TonB family protein